MTIDQATVTFDQDYYTSTKPGCRPTITVKYEDVTLSANVDYYYEYFDNVYPGYGRIVINGWGRFCGERTESFVIREYTGYSETVRNQVIDYEGGTPPVDAQRWNGHYYKRFDTEMTYQEAYDYCISLGGYLVTFTTGDEFTYVKNLISNKSNINTSKKYLVNRTTGDGNGSYTWGNGETTTYSSWTYSNMFTGTYENVIEWWPKNTNYGEQWVFQTETTSGTYPFICEWGDPIPMTETVGEPNTKSYVYAADTERKPGIKVYSDNMLLVENLDYKVSYRNNIEIGKGEIVLTGTGRYTGESIVTFDICSNNVTNVTVEPTAYRELKVTWTTRGENVDGYQIQYSKTSDFAEYVEETVKGKAKAEFTSESVERGKKYYVRVRPYKMVREEIVTGAWSGIVNIKSGNQILATEMWGFKNQGVVIDASYFYRLFDTPEMAEYVYRLYGGNFEQEAPQYASTGGICYGMVMTGVAAIDLKIPSDMYSLKSLDKASTFDLADKAFSYELNMDAQDAIIFSHLLQCTEKARMTQESNENNLYGLYCAVRDCQKGDLSPVAIHFVSEHTVLAVGIKEETDSYVQIAVYDPNEPLNQECYLYIFKDGGNYTSWTFKFDEGIYYDSTAGFRIRYDILGPGETATMLANDVNTGNIQVTQKDLVMLRSEEGMIDKLINYLESLSWEKAITFTDGNLTSKRCYLYEMDLSEPLVLHNLPAGIEVSATTGYHSLTAKVTEQCDIILDIGSTSANQVQIISEKDAKADIIFRDYITLSEPVVQTVIEADCAAGKQATIAQDNSHSLEISGINSADYHFYNGKVDIYSGILTNPSEVEIVTENLDSAKSYKFIETNDSIQFSGSSANDGNYDEVILTEKKCVHSYTNVIEKQSTCSETGLSYEKCTLCSNIKENSIQELPVKTHTYSFINEKTATCTTAGLSYDKCSVCGSIKNGSQKVTEAFGHSFSAWKTTDKASVFNEEKQIRTCSKCKKSESKTLKGTKVAPTIKVTASTVLLKTKQSTTGFKVSGLAAGDSISSMKLSSTKYVKLSKVNRKAGTCKLTAKTKKGTAVLKIKLASGLTKEVKIKVQSTAVKTTKITGISKKLTLKKGKTRQLNPVLAPFTSKEKITYSSSNKKVAKVSSKGLITAVKPGSAKITVKAGKKKVTCTVKVKK